MLDFQIEFFRQLVSHQRSVTSSRLPFDAEERNDLGIRFKVIQQTLGLKVGQAFVFVGLNKSCSQLGASALGGFCDSIGLYLTTSDRFRGRQVFTVQVSNAQLSQSSLQALTVGKSVGCPAHATPLSDVTEGVHPCFLQPQKETGFVKSIDTDSYNFRLYRSHLLSILLARVKCTVKQGLLACSEPIKDFSL